MPTSFSGSIIEIDLNNTEHTTALIQQLNLYALDPMGGGQPLSEEAQQNLVTRLKSVSTFHGLLAVENESFIGLANCFLGFSTFSAAPLLNIHDIAVDPKHRGKGIGRALMEAIDQLANRLDCCAVTLEVRADNSKARQLYLNSGFEPGNSESDGMSFWRKRL